MEMELHFFFAHILLLFLILSALACCSSSSKHISYILPSYFCFFSLFSSLPQVDTETYTTSAAFLLRLLVDEHYVCLVAVAKPLPEPPALPTTMSPRPPPPSLDMPATRAPVLLAGRNAISSRQNRLPIVPGQRLVTNAHHGGMIDGIPAPRSFGLGPDSETNPSSSEEDEEQMQQDSLFDKAHVASTFTTGTTSPPMDDNSSGRMEAVIEEDDGDHEMDEDVAVTETEDQGIRKPHSHGVSSPRTEIAAAATGSHRKSSSSNSKATVLAGPTFDVAPPRAIRVMGAPPLGGMPLESETILGVVSARIKVIQRAADDFGSGSGWTGDKDASWPGLDPKGERSIITREAHIMTLSVLPGERGQGLGARLLDLLLEECKRRTAGPRIHLATGSNTFSEEAITSAPPRAHQDAPMRTVLEMHPSNQAAMQLYKKRNFNQISGNKGTVRHFFRGDQRIPSSIRLRVGGSDAIRMERFDTQPSRQNGIK